MGGVAADQPARLGKRQATRGDDIPNLMRKANERESADFSTQPDLASLAAENARLQRLIRFTLASCAELDRRIDAIEQSLLFRLLRLAGTALRNARQFQARLVHSTRRSARRNHRPDGTYTAWVEEAEGTYGTPGECRVISERWTFRPLLSLIVYGLPLQQAALESTITSIREQAYARWELWICTGATPPEWLSAQAASLQQRGLPAEVVQGNSLQHAIKLTLERSRGEYAALIPQGALVNPRATYFWVESLQDGGADAVYSDWDHIDADGRRHTPRFTPEFSPELLMQTLYWGRCFLVRLGLLRELDWPDAASADSLDHELALRLAERRAKILRIPRILSHLSRQVATADHNATRRAVEAALARRQQSAAVVGTDQPGVVRLRRSAPLKNASIVICSRTPTLLDKCLRSLRSTMDSRHEVLVVAHMTHGRLGLEQVVARYGARIVPYHGPFHFGVMNGLGVSQARESALIFLNDDVRPLEPGWLEAMLGQVAQPDVGVVGALLVYGSHTVQHAGVVVGGRFAPGHAGRWQFESPYWPWLRVTREVTAVTGACLAIRRAVWDELGGFDLRFPVNYNDIDLCLRARRAGYRVLLEAQAVLIHAEAQTRNPVVRPRERQLFFELWEEAVETFDPFFNPNLALPQERIVLAHGLDVF